MLFLTWMVRKAGGIGYSGYVMSLDTNTQYRCLHKVGGWGEGEKRGRADVAQVCTAEHTFWYLPSVSGHSKCSWIFWTKGVQGHLPGSTPKSAVLSFPGLLFLELALTLYLSTVWSQAWYLTTLICSFYKQRVCGLQPQPPRPALTTPLSSL